MTKLDGDGSTLTQEIELDLFLEALRRFHGYDLSSYARPFLMRRVQNLAIHHHLDPISDLIPLKMKAFVMPHLATL